MKKVMEIEVLTNKIKVTFESHKPNSNGVMASPYVFDLVKEFLNAVLKCSWITEETPTNWPKIMFPSNYSRDAIVHQGLLSVWLLRMCQNIVGHVIWVDDEDPGLQVVELQFNDYIASGDDGDVFWDSALDTEVDFNDQAVELLSEPLRK